MVNFLQAFWQATRPRTYPLAVAGIIVANALAYSRIGSFNSKNWQIFLLSLWVALGLQILSNLANDYGDGIRGTDAHRLDRQTDCPRDNQPQDSQEINHKLGTVYFWLRYWFTLAELEQSDRFLHLLSIGHHRHYRRSDLYHG